MLRPATPLSLIFLVAFVFFLLASLSVPIVKNIPLGQHDDTVYGVFGFCKGDDCSDIGLGYSAADLETASNSFKLSPDARKTLSLLLIAHPVAAFFCLVCFTLAFGAHFRSGSHSTRYLLCFVLFTIPTFLFCLFSFIVDILLFIPHVKWGGWVVLIGTILVFIGSIVSCGMRRQLVSRKDQRKRIAENADNLGRNFYGGQAAKATLARVASPPLSNNSVSPYTEKTMGFSTFEMKRSNTVQQDDRVPLNPTKNSFRTMARDTDYNNRYNNNPSPPNDVYGPRAGNGGVAMPYHQRGRGGGPGGYRGGNGFQRGRGGGYPPNGNMMRGPPPPGWNGQRGRARMGQNNGSGYAETNIDSYYETSSSTLPGMAAPMAAPYNVGPSSNSPSPPLAVPVGPYGGHRSQNVSPIQEYQNQGPLNPNIAPARQYQQAPMGQQLQNDAYVPPRTQWTSQPGDPSPASYIINNRTLSPIQGSPIELSRSPAVTDPLDSYLEDVDPRFAPQSPLQPGAQPNNFSRPMRGSKSPPPVHDALPLNTFARSGAPDEMTFSTASGIDLRNIPMRFSETQTQLESDLITQSQSQPIQQPQQPSPLQQQILPNQPTTPQRHLRPPPIGTQDVYNPVEPQVLASGQRSPAALSESSHFTSVSQRGVNPNWRPPQQHRPGPSKEDIILGANPDFSLPATRATRGGTRGRSRGGSMRSDSGRSGSLPGNMGDLRSQSAMSGRLADSGPYAAVPRDGGRYPTPV